MKGKRKVFIGGTSPASKNTTNTSILLVDDEGATWSLSSWSRAILRVHTRENNDKSATRSGCLRILPFSVTDWNGRVRGRNCGCGCICVRSLARPLVRVKSRELPRFRIRNILRKMQIPPGSLAKGNHACQSTRARARVYMCMHAHLGDGRPPHLFVFRSRMPVRKLRRLRRNPRRRHRDFRHRLRESPPVLPSSPRLLRPRSDDWCSRSVG